MKVLAIVLLGLLTFEARSQTDDLIGEWVGASSWRGAGRGIGMVINFKNDGEVVFAGVGTAIEKTLEYKIEKPLNILLLKHEGNFETFGMLKDVSSKLFVLMLPDSSNIEFRRIQKTSLNITKADLTKVLAETSWTSKLGEDSLRIDFRSSHRWGDEQQPFVAMFHYSGERPHKVNETWSVGQYKSYLFLTYSIEQMDHTVHQVGELRPDEISWTEPYNTYDVGNLTRKKELTNIERQKLIDKLCRRTLTSLRVDTLRSNSEGENRQGDKDILTFEKIKGSIEFKFSKENTYTAKISGQEWMHGTWRLTKDGEYILLDDGINTHDWVQVRQAGDKLVLLKLHKFVGGRLGYKLYMFSMTFDWGR